MSLAGGPDVKCCFNPTQSDRQPQPPTTYRRLHRLIAHSSPNNATIPQPQPGIDFLDTITGRTPNFTGREWVFLTIRQWLSDPNGYRYFLLTGEPGIGKTAISDRLTQFSCSPDTHHPNLLPGFLTTVHRCSARDSFTVDPRGFAKSIGLQLAEQIPAFAQALKDIGEKQVNIKIDQQITTATNSNIQAIVIQNLDLSGLMTAQEAFNQVVLNPLHTLYQTGFDKPITILVDSLDEALTHSGDRTIVDLLSSLDSLPPQVRFILTSRQVSKVENQFLNAQKLNLSDSKFASQNQSDLHAYTWIRCLQNKTLSAHLSDLETHLQEITINQIIQKSEGNFLYVRFLLDEIEQGKRSISDLAGLPEGLDGLYYESLNRVVKLNSQDWRTTYAPLIGILTAARTSLTLSQLQAFTGQSESTLWQCLGDLREFLEELETPTSSASETNYRLYHQSIVDFLGQRSSKNIQHNSYYLPPKESHQQIVNYYKKHTQLWQVSAEDTYYWYYFVYHLCELNEIHEINSLLCNFNWLQSKLNATSANSLSLDYDLLQNDSDLRLVQKAIQMAMHTLNQDQNQLAGQLLGRIPFCENPSIQSLLQQAEQWKGTCWLRPLRASLTSPKTALLRTITGHSQYIRALVIMSDGKMAVSGSDDGTLRVWNIETGENLRTLQEQSGSVDALAFMPNTKQVLAAVRDGSLKIWDLSTGNILHSWQTHHTRSINAIAITPNAQLAVSVSNDGTLRVWDLISRELIEILQEHTNWVQTVTITPNGNYVISGGADNILQVWDLQSSAQPLTLRGHQHWVRAVIATPDSQKVISGSVDHTLKIWDLESGEILHSLQGHTGEVTSVAMVDQQRVISASNDCTLRVWNIETGTTLKILTGHTGAVRHVAVTPDGRKAISAAIDNTLKVWDLDSAIEQDHIQSESIHRGSVAILPSGDRAISTISNLSKAPTNLTTWSLQDGTACDSLEQYGWSSDIFTILPDGQKVIAASRQQLDTELAAFEKAALKIWDLKTGKELLTLADPAGGILAIAVTPDGKIAVTASRDKTLRVWDLNNETELRVLRDQDFWRICAMAITADCQVAILAGSLENDLRVWDLQDSTELRPLKGHAGHISAVETLPGRLAISASSDHTLKIWDLESAEVLYTLTGHNHGVADVAVTPNGTRAVSVSYDCTLKVWSLENRKLIASFVADVPLIDCAISENGKSIIAVDSLAEVHIFHLEELLIEAKMPAPG
jgi:WD40 repeat protein